MLYQVALNLELVIRKQYKQYIYITSGWNYFGKSVKNHVNKK